MDAVGYKKLIVWQKADELAYQVYVATKSFPKDETYGMISQLRRAALSIPTNIVEGVWKAGKKRIEAICQHSFRVSRRSQVSDRFLSQIGLFEQRTANYPTKFSWGSWQAAVEILSIVAESINHLCLTPCALTPYGLCSCALVACDLWLNC